MASDHSASRPIRQNRRFEGVSLIYLAFFVLAVLAPSIITRDYFGVSQTVLEEILIFITGLAGLVTFTVYERVLEKRIQERDDAEANAERAKRELVESYKYIGSMNRQMEVLKKLANQTSMSLITDDAYWKDLLQSLASNAASCADASRVLIRFVELKKLRTEREVHFSANGIKPISVSNRDLRTLAEVGHSHSFARTESGDDVLVVASDKKDSPVKAHVILAVDPTRISDVEISLLKVLANQAELVYHHLLKPKVGGSPLALTEAVTSDAVGEVS